MTQSPAVTEAPATTTEMPSAVHAHLGGEETHATQVRLQDDECQANGGVAYVSGAFCTFKIRQI